MESKGVTTGEENLKKEMKDGERKLLEVEVPSFRERIGALNQVSAQKTETEAEIAEIRKDAAALLA